MQHRLYRLLALLGVLLLASCWLFAQGESGTISGIVTDSSNAVVPGATVTVVSTGTGLTRSATTASAGEYAITNLPPATYTLTIEHSGFDKYSRQVTLAVGDTWTCRHSCRSLERRRLLKSPPLTRRLW